MDREGVNSYYSPATHLYKIKNVDSGKEFFVSKQSFNNAVKENFIKSVEVITEDGKKSFKIPAKMGIVRRFESIKKINAGNVWAYYEMNLLDDDGNCLRIVDSEMYEKVTGECPVYRSSKINYDKTILVASVEKFGEVKKELDELRKSLRTSCNKEESNIDVETIVRNALSKLRLAANTTAIKFSKHLRVPSSRLNF